VEGEKKLGLHRRKKGEGCLWVADEYRFRGRGVKREKNQKSLSHDSRFTVLTGCEERDSREYGEDQQRGGKRLNTVT